MSGALFAVLCAAAPAWPDTVLLHNGGRLQGEIVADAGGDDILVVRTLLGGTVAIPRNQVREILPPSQREREYGRLRDQTPETIEGHLALAQWCKERSLTKRRKAHLAQVLRLDPDHDEARRLLGYTYVEGRWMTPEQRRLARGYVRYRGRWRLPQEVELLQSRERDKEIAGHWYRNVKLWHGWIHNDPERRGTGIDKLRAVSAPAALPALNRFLAADPTAEVRLLFVDIVAGIPGPAAVKALVARSLADASRDVRWAAVERLLERKADDAVPLYVRALRHENNLLVRRAAQALGELGDARAVLPLIDALVTVHTIPAPQDGATGVGSLRLVQPETTPMEPGAVPAGPLVPITVPSGTVFSPGGGSPREIDVPVENHEALFSLNKLTGQNFGFDAAAWKNWWEIYLESSDSKVLEGP